MAKKRGLGRGLDALLSGATIEQQMNTDLGPISNNDLTAVDGYQMLEVSKIQRGKYQPRRDLEPQALEDLSNSIRAQGVIQPIIIRPVSADMYEIIAGERRWQATQLAGLDTIPVMSKMSVMKRRLPWR